jgi:hypothetical protein
MKRSWVSALLLLLSTSPSHGTEAFSHHADGIAWEAEVTEDTFALREGKGGTLGRSEYVCPLGPAVRASVVRATSGAARLCLVFSAAKCAFKTREGAPATPSAQQPGAGVFKCIEPSAAGQADALAALVNAGPRTQGHAASTGASAGTRRAATHARDSGPAFNGASPQKPSLPTRSAGAPPVADSVPQARSKTTEEARTP